MSIKDLMEAEFKTLDDDNPIDVVTEDVVLQLQRIGLKYYGEDTIACFDGFTDLEEPKQFRASFSIRSRKNGRWDRLALVEAYCEWAPKPGAVFRVYEIEEH
jgi:hypothetical protein